MHKAQSGSPVKVTVPIGNAPSSLTPPNEADYAAIHQALYILDRFAVSDEAYRERSVTSNLPPLHHVKMACSRLNESLDLRSLLGGIAGAYLLML